MVAAPTSLPARALRGGRLAARIDAATAPLLVGLIGVSVAVRLVVGWFRATPNYFPDEYLYAELARSLVEAGRPTVRGLEIGFPSLLQPILTAPSWLFDDVVVSYRLTQALGAVAMSLVALPAFVLARRLGVARPLALGAAALSVAVPDLLYASWVMAEPFAYPLFVAAVLTGTVALAEPTRRRGVAFVALVVLASFARIQFALLPLCFAVAVLVVGWREKRLRAVVREQVVPLGAFAAGGLVVGAIGLSRVLGMYGGVLDGGADPVELAQRVGLNALVLAFASGWIVVPAALVGVALCVSRPRSRAELAFGALFSTTTLALLLEASLAGDVDRAQQRYAFYVLPLVGVAFCVYASRGWPARVQLALVSAALIVVSAQVPLAGFTAADGKSQSSFLLAAFRLEELVGSPGTGSLLVAGAAALLGLGLIVLSSRPSVATPVALAAALAACVLASVGAVAFDTRNSSAVRASFLPEEPSWVDRTGLGEVTLVRGPDGVRTEALEQLFWNRSVDRVVLLPGAEEADHFQSAQLRVGTDGTLRADGRNLTGPVLLDGYGGTLELAHARRVASSQSFTLWQPDGDAQLSAYLAGRYSDGWLASVGRLYLWPERPGARIGRRVTLTLSPPGGEDVTMRFVEPGKAPRALRLVAGRATSVSFDVCSRGPWYLTYSSSVRGFVGTRVIGARAKEPQVVPTSCGGDAPPPVDVESA